MRPTAKVMLPHQSSRAFWRTPVSCSLRYAQTVPNSPNGTETRNTRCQLTGASRPPTTSPMNEPEMAATALMPSASPRWCSGKASVRIAEELANNRAPPTPCSTRMTISHRAASVPFIQVTDSRTENTVKTAKPRLYIRTRP